MTKLIDLIGMRFGMLVVLSRADNTPTGHPRWLCRCEHKNCGKEVVVRGDHLRRSNNEATVSCGCYGRIKSITHGHSVRGRSPTYSSWTAMIARCTNPNNKHYADYGGRGIQVCAHWRSFESFLADMGEKPPGTSLDRFPDGNGNYEPGNCRWATPTQQSRNSRRCKLDADKVQEIHGRCEHGETQRSVAARFGITEEMVFLIRHGKAWSDQLGGPT